MFPITSQFDLLCIKYTYCPKYTISFSVKGLLWRSSSFLNMSNRVSKTGIVMYILLLNRLKRIFENLTSWIVNLIASQVNGSLSLCEWQFIIVRRFLTKHEIHTWELHRPVQKAYSLLPSQEFYLRSGYESEELSWILLYLFDYEFIDLCNILYFVELTRSCWLLITNLSLQ